MKYTSIKENGFSAVESLLLLVLVLIIGGTGYYVWHAQQQTNKTLTAASNEKFATPTKKSTTKTTNKPSTTTTNSNQGYFVIKEWGVRSPYSGPLHLKYSFATSDTPTQSNNDVIFSSTELEAGSSTKCSGDQREILRYALNDHVYFTYNGTTKDYGDAASYFANPDPTTAKNLKKIAGYYYLYYHPLELCSYSSDINAQIDNTVQSLVQNLEAVPTQ